MGKALDDLIASSQAASLTSLQSAYDLGMADRATGTAPAPDQSQIDAAVRAERKRIMDALASDDTEHMKKIGDVINPPVATPAPVDPTPAPAVDPAPLTPA